MTGRRTAGMVFIVSLLFAVLSISWLVFRIIDDVDLIFTERVYQFILAIGCLSFFAALVYLHRFLADMRYEINEVKEKEKNVIDFYRYHQFLNPPDMDS